MKKRILALICALAMSVTMVAPAQASALTGSAVADNTVENAVSDNTEEPVITETIVSDVNPVYKDVVSGLSTSEETEFSLYSEDETPPENCETDLNVVINAIREAMKAREESLYIEYQHDADLGEQFLTEWVRMAVAETGNPKEGDYLRFHYQHSDGLAKTWTYSSGIKKSKIDISFQYYSNAEQEAAVDAAIETLIGTLGINNAMSDYEKVKAVYDYMCENITYDYDNLNDDTYTLKYSAYAALINRTSVCQGYANLLYRLLNEVGVNARIISGIGNGGPHSWNIIKLGDYYYLADATWDAPRAEKGMEYEYFLKGSDNFTDHVCDEEYAGYEFAAEYPIAAEDYVYVPVEIVAEGSCGDNATWTLDVDGELRISGSGAITDNTEFGEYKDQIKTLVIEEGITEIGESVFNKYSGFTGSLELPDSLTSIGDMAFFCCSGFTGNLELPDNLTDLGESVFSQCSGLNGNLTLPENLKSIGNEAFRSCTGLKGNLELPEGLTSIGESAFYGCTGFDGRLKLPQNLKTIESGVFMNCTGLNGELELPEGLTKVDMYAFTSCSGFDGNLELPESLMSVGYNAFGSTSFDKIIVRNASCDIEQSKPTLPQNAIINGYIDSTAHAYAKKFGRDFLCILHLWNENFTIDKESSCEEEGTKSIHCSVCDIVDESTREVISATGHTYATVLSNDTYNHWYECHCGVKKDVNSHEFEWLVDLEPTEEMTGLKHEECTICKYSRNENTEIEKLPHTQDLFEYEFKTSTTVKIIGIKEDAVIPEELIIPTEINGYKVTAIGEFAFSNQNNLKSLIIPESVDTLETYSIYNCQNLEYIKLPNSLKNISWGPIQGCEKMKTAGPTAGDYNFEFDWTTKVPDYIFNMCGELESVVLPDTIEYIGASSFGSTAIEEFIFPENLKVIATNAFNNCTNLIEIEVPNREIVLERGAFSHCSNLKKLVIPEKVKVKEAVFGNCPKFVTAGPIGGGYDVEFNWKDTIPYDAFSNCTGLESIVLPSTITEIGDNAFYECTNLKSIKLPHNIERINNLLFYGCKSLTEIEIPVGVTTIEADPFYECRNLTKVTIPKTVTSISSNTFQHCYDLTIYGFTGTVAENYAKVNDIPFVALEDLTFSDVRATDWFYSAVDFVARNGLMTGMNETTFGPAINLSRAQFAVILWRMNGSPVMDYKATFPDVPAGTWYTDAVLWANQKGIITGYSHNGHFGSADNITREQMALMMFRYGNFKGFDVSQRADFGAFKDATSVSGFASEAMKWTVANGIITGKQNGTALEPQGNASRAECATIIMRFMNTYE